MLWLHETKNVEKKICYKYIDSFIVYIKTEDIYVDTTKAFEIKNKKLERPLPRGIWLKERWINNDISNEILMCLLHWDQKNIVI